MPKPKKRLKVKKILKPKITKTTIKGNNKLNTPKKPTTPKKPSKIKRKSNGRFA